MTLTDGYFAEKDLPFAPHDYQLEGVTEALDGNDVMAITATGSVHLHARLDPVRIGEEPYPIFHWSSFSTGSCSGCNTALEEDQVRHRV
jgi:hypothetical protein